ncbi:hypothetical protein [Salirhabdus salicampi]|uniref:hypothetical protein n=1 Tax=Salirhabdus salicampi TaxID=476102 RepID=UPI0020C4F012|nr:hypothetical protein [Salirhabdus salicampi]MCP8616331.1 hypothetical protein [Salirhabdus salicampi]
MKKGIIGVLLFVIMAVSSFVYLENNKKTNSYSTPEQALSNVKNPKFDVLEIIDTKFYDNVAYVFFYSEVDIPKNYLATGKIKKNKYGWQFDEIIGVGNIDNDNTGLLSGKGEYIIGLASKEVDKVMFGTHEVDIIPLDNQGIKAWLFHGLESNNLNQADFDIKYLDKEGNELP